METVKSKPKRVTFVAEWNEPLHTIFEAAAEWVKKHENLLGGDGEGYILDISWYDRELSINYIKNLP